MVDTVAGREERGGRRGLIGTRIFSVLLFLCGVLLLRLQYDASRKSGRSSNVRSYFLEGQEAKRWPQKAGENDLPTRQEENLTMESMSTWEGDGALAVSPQQEVLLEEDLTLFGLWRVPTDIEEKRKYQCVFDFSRPTLELGGTSRSSWNFGSAWTQMYRLETAETMLRYTDIAWMSLDGRVVKCRAPAEVPAAVASSHPVGLVTVLTSVRDARGDVLPSAALMRLRVNPADDVYRGLTVQRFDERGQDVEICICTMVRNGASRLREFLEYHRQIGVGAVILYDNGSDDETPEVLRPYLCSERVGDDGFAVRVVNWHYPRESHHGRNQRQAFSHCLEEFGARPAEALELKLDDTIRLVDRGNRHHLRAQAEGRPQCGMISFTDVDEFLVPDPFYPREAKHPTKELPELVASIRANDTKDSGVMSIYLDAYAVGSAEVIDLPPPRDGIQPKLTELFTRRSLDAVANKKMIVARRYYPGLTNHVHHWHYHRPNQTSIARPIDRKRECPKGASKLCNAAPLLTMYHFRFGSWRQFLTKWVENGVVTGYNESFVDEVTKRHEAMRAAGKTPIWPTVDEMLANHLLLAKSTRLEQIFRELSASTEVDNRFNIARYFPRLWRTLDQNHSFCRPYDTNA